jgi:hypothetical protein
MPLMNRTLTAMALALLLSPTLAPAPVLAKPAAKKTSPHRPTAGPHRPVERQCARQRPHPAHGLEQLERLGSGVTEARVMASVEVIRANGLDAKGYRHIDIDEGWWQKRRESDGRVLVRTAAFPRRPRPMATPRCAPLPTGCMPWGLADLLRHWPQWLYPVLWRGERSGLPTGTMAEREVGLYGHTDQDIRLYFQEWNFDLIKVDGCGIRAMGPDAAGEGGLYRPLAPVINFDLAPYRHCRGEAPVWRGVQRAGQIPAQQ